MNKLEKLFEYQMFENNKKLESLINETLSSEELADESLELVFGAGQKKPEQVFNNNEEDKK